MKLAHIFMTLLFVSTIFYLSCVSDDKTSCPDVQCNVQDVVEAKCETFYPDITCPGCGDTTCAQCPDVKTSQYSVFTKIDNNSVTAGTQVTVSCEVLKNGVKTAEKTTEILIVNPEKDTSKITVSTFTPEKAGAYQIICIIPDESIVDMDGAKLDVLPSSASKIKTKLSLEQIVAGGESEVACIVADKYDNEIKNFETDVEAPAEINLFDSKISGIKPGNYTIKCKEKTAGTYNYETATLIILASAPEKLKLAVTPQKNHYIVGDSISVSFKIYDKFNNTIEGAVIDDFIIEPSSGVTVNGLTFTFTKENSYTFTTSVKNFPLVKESFSVTVDATGPVIKIGYPPRGATLSGFADIAVVGYAGDPSQITQFKINNNAVTLNKDGTFEFPMTASLGMNLIHVEAVDTYGNISSLGHSFYYSNYYYPMDYQNPDGSMVKNAGLAYFSKDLFLNDLSFAAKVYFSDILKTAQVPNPVYTSSSYNINLTNFVYESVDVVVQPVIGGLKGTVLISDISADLEFDGVCGDPNLCPDDTGKGKITLMKTIMELSMKLGEDGKAVIELANASADISGMSIISNILPPDFIEIIKDYIKNYFTDTFKQVIQDNLNEIVETSFASIFPIGYIKNIPPAIKDGVEIPLIVTAEINNVEFNNNEAWGALDSMFYSTVKKVNKKVLGSLSFKDCIPGYEAGQEIFKKTNNIELAMSTDSLNQALYALWAAGYLNGEILDSMLPKAAFQDQGMTDVTLTLDLNLPPIVNNCTSGQKHYLEFGDIYANLKFKYQGINVTLGFFFSMRETINVYQIVEEGTAKICLIGKDILDSEVDIIEINPEAKSKEKELRNKILTGFIPAFFTTSKGVGVECFEVPSINWKDYGLPYDTTITPDFTEFWWTDGYLLGGANVKY
jgi:hypothetical protein